MGEKQKQKQESQLSSHRLRNKSKSQLHIIKSYKSDANKFIWEKLSAKSVCIPNYKNCMHHKPNQEITILSIPA